MSEQSSTTRPSVDATRSLMLELDAFAWEALADEARKMGVSIEELGEFALMYFIADRDSGRLARRLPPRELGGSEQRKASKLRVR